MHACLTLQQVVVASLVLELVLRSSELREVVALLIVFRLW
jgi:hypothetical protein